MHQDTDSDVAEQRDSGKMKVKWTQDEVTAMTCPSDLHTLSLFKASHGSDITSLFLCGCRMTSSRCWFRNSEPMIGNVLPASYQ